MSYSALKPSACNFGVTARIPSRPILLSSDSVAVKLLNTVDSINNLVQSYLKLFSQTKILTICYLFIFLMLGYQIWAASVAQVVGGCSAQSPLWFLLVTSQSVDNWFWFYFKFFFFFSFCYFICQMPLPLWIPWNLCCRYVG